VGVQFRGNFPASKAGRGVGLGCEGSRSLVNTWDTVLERYMCEPYGKPEVLDADWHGGRRSGLSAAQPANQQAILS